MPRERRDFKRTSGLRDASLVVIACEGAVTEPVYFNGIKAFLHNPRLHIEVLRREDPTLSAPEHVQRMLQRFTDEYRRRDGDTFWLVADRDRQSWSDAHLSRVATECQQRGFSMAISNPCFELWLLLHFEELHRVPEQEREELERNENDLLRRRFGAYRRGNATDWELCQPHWRTAAGRARILDTGPGDRWPQRLGTHVYRLVELLLDGEPTRSVG
jgi:hypothetical protein